MSAKSAAVRLRFSQTISGHDGDVSQLTVASIVGRPSLPLLLSEQFSKPLGLLIAQPTRKLLGRESPKDFPGRKTPKHILRRQPPQAPFDGNRLQYRRLQFLFQLAHVFRVRVLHDKLLPQTAELLNLLQRVAQQHSVARSRQLFYYTR